VNRSLRLARTCTARLLVLTSFAGILLLSGCFDFDVSMRTHSGFREFVGKTYVLKEDLYITSSDYGKGYELKRYYPDSGFGDQTLPKTVDSKNIGSRTLNNRIEDVIPAGSRIRVVDVIRTRVEFSHWTWLVCDVEVAGIVKWRNVSTIFIQSSIDGDGGRVPVLRTEAVEEAVQSSGPTPSEVR